MDFNVTLFMCITLWPKTDLVNYNLPLCWFSCTQGSVHEMRQTHKNAGFDKPNVEYWYLHLFHICKRVIHWAEVHFNAHYINSWWKWLDWFSFGFMENKSCVYMYYWNINNNRLLMIVNMFYSYPVFFSDWRFVEIKIIHHKKSYCYN